MKLPWHIILRRKLSNIITKLLWIVFGSKLKYKKTIDEKITSVVIIRPNYRIGNILFLTPLINGLEKLNPNIKIDVIVGAKVAGSTLLNMPNVNNIIDINRKLLLNPYKLFLFIKNIRKNNYDVALNISGSSTSAQIVTLFINSTYIVGFVSKNNFVPYTHLISNPLSNSHMAIQPLGILNVFSYNLESIENISLDIKLTDKEIKDGKEELKKISNKKNIITIFRGARYEKKLSDMWWSKFVDELLKQKKDIEFIDISSPDVPDRLNDKVKTYSNKNLRKLGAFFRASTLYISADTGILHLAVASGANTVGLYNQTSSKLHGALSKNAFNFDIKDKKVEDIAYEILKIIS